MITIHSIQIGRVVTEGDPESRSVHDREWTSAFNKQPVGDGPIEVGHEGLEGDEIADRRFHGGPDKAILCYAMEHYPKWNAEHADVQFGPGGFGENLTLSGTNESNPCIGDSYQIGDVRLQVSQPRQPCWKVSRRWGIKSLVKEVAQSGRTGWYMRVLQQGTLSTGQDFQLLDRPNPEWTVARANDILFGRETDVVARSQLSQLPELAQAWKDCLS